MFIFCQKYSTREILGFCRYSVKLLKIDACLIFGSIAEHRHVQNTEVKTGFLLLSVRQQMTLWSRFKDDWQLTNVVSYRSNKWAESVRSMTNRIASIWRSSASSGQRFRGICRCACRWQHVTLFIFVYNFTCVTLRFIIIMSSHIWQFVICYLRRLTETDRRDEQTRYDRWSFARVNGHHAEGTGSVKSPGYFQPFVGIFAVSEGSQCSWRHSRPDGRFCHH